MHLLLWYLLLNLLRRAVKGELPGHQRERKHPDAPHVRALVVPRYVLLLLQSKLNVVHLRRYVGRRSQPRHLLIVQLTREAQVAHLRVPILSKQEVLLLQITVYDIMLVQVAGRRAHLHHRLQRLLSGKTAAGVCRVLHKLQLWHEARNTRHNSLRCANQFLYIWMLQMTMQVHYLTLTLLLFSLTLKHTKLQRNRLISLIGSLIHDSLCSLS